MIANAQTKAEVETFLHNFLDCYRTRDLDRLTGMVSPDNDLYLLGTGIDEKRTGLQEFKYQAERDWAQTEALDFEINPSHIAAAGSVAWVAADGLGKGKAGGQIFEFPLRMTAVLENRDGKWLLVQGHLSLPAPGEEPGNSVPV